LYILVGIGDVPLSSTNMLVYAGIDEAGYGPMFGPLCVGASVMVLENYDPADGEPDLWEILNNAICKKRSDRRKRIAVNDSKKLKSSSTPKGLKHLERGVLSFLATVPVSDTEFFTSVGCALPKKPWTTLETKFPIAMDPSSLQIDIACLARELQRTSVRCDWLTCKSIDVQNYNERTSLASKAALNFATAMQLVESIASKFPTEHPRIMIDRHGGRIRYRQDLQQAWPDAKIQILVENNEMSRYRLDIDGRKVTMTFASRSDEKHMPVALASMIAKFTRELHMLRFNKYFATLVEGIKPTAGYVQDGRRFLKEIEPILEQNNLAREYLIRNS
jgi:ribonuclease HII